jgi:hypothetical protein
MTSDLEKKFIELRSKQLTCHSDLRQLCNVLVHVLKDHNLKSLADQLGAKLFELDALDGELRNAVEADPEAAFTLLLNRLVKKQ